jgi:VanZ family protein
VTSRETRRGEGPSALSRWLPVAVWAGVIAVFSSDGFSGDHTRSLLLPLLRFVLPQATPETLGLVHDVVRKLAHPTEYGILAALAARAYARPRRPPAATHALAFAATALWASLDELHQSTVASRTGAVGDVVLDLAGAAVGLFVWEIYARWRSRAGAAPPLSAGRRSRA